MKREIKFRAWDGKKMWYGGEEYQKGNDFTRSYPCYITNKGIHFVKTPSKKYQKIIAHNNQDYYLGWDCWEIQDDVDIMQCIGLKDKNGKEIFEGDILGYGPEDPSISKVVYHKGSFCELFNTLRVNSSPSIIKEVDCELCQVIGNIHENHEKFEPK